MTSVYPSSIAIIKDEEIRELNVFPNNKPDIDQPKISVAEKRARQDAITKFNARAVEIIEDIIACKYDYIAGKITLAQNKECSRTIKSALRDHHSLDFLNSYPMYLYYDDNYLRLLGEIMAKENLADISEQMITEFLLYIDMIQDRNSESFNELSQNR